MNVTVKASHESENFNPTFTVKTSSSVSVVENKAVCNVVIDNGNGDLPLLTLDNCCEIKITMEGEGQRKEPVDRISRTSSLSWWTLHFDVIQEEPCHFYRYNLVIKVEVNLMVKVIRLRGDNLMKNLVCEGNLMVSDHSSPWRKSGRKNHVNTYIRLIKSLW